MLDPHYDGISAHLDVVDPHGNHVHASNVETAHSVCYIEMLSVVASAGNK